MRRRAGYEELSGEGARHSRAAHAAASRAFSGVALIYIYPAFLATNGLPLTTVWSKVDVL